MKQLRDPTTKGVSTEFRNGVSHQRQKQHGRTRNSRGHR
jgi:hypothetical protein